MAEVVVQVKANEEMRRQLVLRVLQIPRRMCAPSQLRSGHWSCRI